MATLSNERHLRYILLLGEGGTLVLREILEREKTRSGKPLGDLIKAKESLLKRKIEKHALKKVFGSGGIQNENTWDICLLATVIIQLFKNSLNTDEKYNITQLKDLRNDLAHVSTMSMNADEYDDARKELSAILIKLTNGLDREIHDKCQNFIKDFTTGPIDLHSATERVKELGKNDDIIRTELGKLTGKIEDISTEVKVMAGKVDTVSDDIQGNFQK